MSTKDAHECTCGHTRRRHEDGVCLGKLCRCDSFERKRPNGTTSEPRQQHNRSRPRRGKGSSD